MNKYTFIDTNVILRYLLADDAKLSKQAQEIVMKGVEGKLKLFTNSLVVAELFYVLEEYYKASRAELAEMIISFLVTTRVTLADRNNVLAAIVYYVDLNVDFEDAYSYAQMQSVNIDCAASFDRKHFKRFSQVKLLTSL